MNDRAIDTIVLSPHLDDAALSCGGLIHQRAAAGRRVSVVNVCAGTPGDDPVSAYAAMLHARWGTPQDASAMVARRRREDEVALCRLGAEGHYLDVLDAIYRRDPGTGAWLYPSETAIFDHLSAREARLVARVADQVAQVDGLGPATELLTPLTIGGHVDHQLVRRAAERLSEHLDCHVAYYEDYPYADDARAVADVLSGTRSERWAPEPIALTEADLRAKIEAVAAYASQISTFWPDSAAMARAVRDYANRRGPGAGPAEQLWRHR